MFLLLSFPLEQKFYENKGFVLANTVPTMPIRMSGTWWIVSRCLARKCLIIQTEYESEPFLLYIYLYTFLVPLTSIQPFSFLSLPPFLPLPTTFFQQKDFSLWYIQQMSQGQMLNQLVPDIMQIICSFIFEFSI